MEGSYKRSVMLAMVVGSGNITGAVSSNIVGLLRTRYPPASDKLSLVPRQGQAMVHPWPRDPPDVHLHRVHLGGRVPHHAQTRERPPRPW